MCYSDDIDAQSSMQRALVTVVSEARTNIIITESDAADSFVISFEQWKDSFCT